MKAVNLRGCVVFFLDIAFKRIRASFLCSLQRLVGLGLATFAGVVWPLHLALAIDLTLGNGQVQSEPITVTENSTIQTQSGGTESAFQSGNISFSSPFILTLNPVDSTDQLTVIGIVSGDGSLVVAGAGTTILSGTNTFTGGVSVTGTGKLRALNSEAFGTGTVTINNSAATLEFASVEMINGFVLNTNSSFSTVEGGLDEAFLYGTVTLNANSLSLVSVDATDSLSVNGVISGTGAITVSGAGTVLLSGANTFSGGITVTGPGTLVAGNSLAFGTGTVTVNAADASIGFGTATNVANDVTLLTNARFIVSGSSAGTGQLSGDVNINGNILTLLPLNNFDRLVISGNISGSGSLVVDGAGTVVLSGVNTYTGGTNITTGGSLQVNGSILGQTTVNSLGTLSGIGTVGSVTVDGVIAPGLTGGAGLGTLTTTGNVVFNTGSALRVNLSPTGTSDLLNVGGTTAINSGATVDANLALTSFVVGQTYTVLNSTGSLSGAFGSVTSNYSFLGLTLIQVGNTVQVQIASVNALATVADATSYASAVSAGNTAVSGSAIVFSPSTTVNLAANATAFDIGTGNSLYVLGYNSTINGNGFTALTLQSGTLAITGLTVNGAVQLNGGTLGINGDTSIGTLTGEAAAGLQLQRGTLTLNQSDNSTFAGTISGSGDLIVNGSGTLTLSATNTYSGGTELAGSGGVVVTANRGLGTGTVTINNASASVALGDDVSLPNVFVLNSAGQLKTISGGTEETTLTGAINLNTNALNLLAVDSTDVLTARGIISGTGGLTINGSGSVILAGNNTFSGNVSLDGDGDVVASDDHALGTGQLVFNNDGATLNIDNEIEVANNILMNSDATVGTASENTEDATFSGTITTQGNTLFLKPSDSADTLTVSGIVSGTGAVVKEGDGTAVLASNQTYSGGTTVNDGTLLLNGTVTGLAVVNAQGTFGGTGTLTGNLEVSGTVAPGASIGTLNVIGDVAFGATSVFNPEVSSEDGSDLLNVTGTINFDGSTLLVSPLLGDFPIGSSFTVASATGGITGTFSSLASSISFFAPSYEILGNNLLVSLEVIDIRPYAETDNQSEVAALIDEILQNAAQPDGLLSEDQIFVFDSLYRDFNAVPENLDVLSGSGQATFATTAIAELSTRNGNLTRHINHSRRCYLPKRDEDEFRSNCVVLSQSPGRLARSGENIARMGKGMFWVEGYHGNASGSASFGEGFDLTGFDLGFDGWLGSGILIGASGGYSRVQGDNFATISRGETEKGYASLYSSKSFSNDMYLTGIFTAGFGDMETFRPISFGSVNRSARGQFTGHVFSGYGEFGYDFMAGSVAIQPFAAVQYLGINFSDYTETGGGALNLQVDGIATSSLQGMAGITASRVFYDVFWGFNFEPEIYVKFTQELGSAKDDLVTEVKFIENVSKASIVQPGSFSSGLNYGGSLDVSRGGKMRITFDVDFFQSKLYDITTLGGRASWVF